jgi:Repeat of unknown function (DUF5650)/Calx-beta domain/Divergent InlB B-repeat domain
VGEIRPKEEKSKLLEKNLPFFGQFAYPTDQLMKNTLILLVGLAVSCTWTAKGYDIQGPIGSGAFGSEVVYLQNGDFVITDPMYDESSPTLVQDVGAVYHYNAAGTLIATLKGSSANDRVGLHGVVKLSNGNYVVRSGDWDDGSTADVGAVTWCDGATGLNGVVSSANSLIGSTASDAVGGSAGSVKAVGSGNYVVCTPTWSLGANSDVGAVTWCDGSVSTADSVSVANSRIGSAQGDKVGGGGITVLPSGDFVVISKDWANGASPGAGAVFFGLATSLTPGPVSAANSVVGSITSDYVGSGGITVLSNGNYVIASPSWNLLSGAATWCSGTSATPVGAVSGTNSVIGGAFADQVSSGGIKALTNGNYVVSSPQADNGSTNAAGAATWGNGTTGTVGTVDITNSLMGSNTQDQISGTSVTALVSGKYVVCSSNWSFTTGASTLCDGTIGTVGTVSTTNSLVGDSPGDRVGGGGVVDLLNGHYVVLSPVWDDGSVTNAGAVTWVNGATGIFAAVSQSNSLFGANINDRVGSGGVTVLSTGDFVIVSPLADLVYADIGVCNWCPGNIAVSGSVQSLTNIRGTAPGDGIGMTVTGIDGAGYVICMPSFDGQTAVDVGAIFNVDNVVQNNYSIVISGTNAITGTAANDQVGSGGVTKLNSGRCLVRSPSWNGPSGLVGAITYIDSPPNFIYPAAVSATNSIVGEFANDTLGTAVKILSDNNYLIHSPSWNGNNGAITYGYWESPPRAGFIATDNSVLNTGAAFTYSYDDLAKRVLVGRAGSNSAVILETNAFNFSQREMIVTERAGTFNVPIRLSGTLNQTQSVDVSTTAGTATANADFRSISTQTKIFIAGNGLINVPLSILSGNALNEPNETFTVNLSNPIAFVNPMTGATLGLSSSLKVTIVDVNSTPTGAPTITNPTASQVLNIAAGTIRVTGNATDQDTVVAVEVSLNQGAWQSAVLVTGPGVTTDYTSNITPIAGLNEVFVRSVDALGNRSPISARSFVVNRPLVVAVAGPGTVTAGFVPSSFRVIGSSVSITAKPNAGALFNGWTVTGPPASIASITQAMLDQPTLTFTMAEGLTVTAQFATNPFVPANVGVFNGLVSASSSLPDYPPFNQNFGEDGTAVSSSTEGYFSITLLTKATFSGKIQLGGLTHPISGSLDANGIAHFGKTAARVLIVTRTNRPSLKINMVMTFGPNPVINGTIAALDLIQNTVAYSDFALRAGYSATSPVSASFLGLNNAPQLYTCSLPSLPVGQQFTLASIYPQGYGIAILTLTKLGTVTMTGTLADGSPFTTSTTVSNNMEMRTFATLYKGKGYLSGTARFDVVNLPDADLFSFGNWLWLRPQDLLSQYYAAGWQNLQLRFTGAKFRSTAGQSSLKASGGFPLSLPDNLGNATLSLSQGQLSSPIQRTLNVTPTNLVQKLPTTDTSYTLKIDPKTGIVTGDFLHTQGARSKFKAIILQKGITAGARGYFLTPAPKPIDYTGASGFVEFLGR